MTFDKIFNQKIGKENLYKSLQIVIKLFPCAGFQLFKDYCENYRDEPVPQLKFYEEIRNYEKTECPDERKKLAKSIYDNFIMKEMLSHTHVSRNHSKIIDRRFESHFESLRNTPRSAWLMLTVSCKKTRYPPLSSNLTLRRSSIICEAIRSSALWRVHDTRGSFSGRIWS